jgi:hypothetical protein
MEEKREVLYHFTIYICCEKINLERSYSMYNCTNMQLIGLAVCDSISIYL